MNHDSVLVWLAAAGLVEPGEHPTIELLGGGVSSDVLRIDLRRGAVCVKSALAKLKVQGDWRAPVERNAHEVAWIQMAQRFVGHAVPEVLAVDPTGHSFAMPFYPSDRYFNWKEQLRDGVIDTAFAAAVGEVIALVHRGTAGSEEAAASFAYDTDFAALRLDPYLRATAESQPDVADALMRLHRRTGSTHLTLVHGDVSPKNILVGPDGPLLLDAECAWYGDPAFDVAFCLNHFMLKCVWHRQWTENYMAAFHAFVAAYRPIVTWEPWVQLEERIASLLPGLMLARIDGLSPAEYITSDEDKSLVRSFAKERLIVPPRSLDDIRTDWARAIPPATQR